MNYAYTAADQKMMGWIGDSPDKLTLHLACDADFAGCPYTLRSTSGCHFDIQGPNSRMPLSAGSNQQTSTAQSTPEAELASLQSGMKTEVRPHWRFGNSCWGCTATSQPSPGSDLHQDSLQTNAIVIDDRDLQIDLVLVLDTGAATEPR